MHDDRIVPFDEIRPITVAGEEALQLVVADPRQHRRAGDLVPVEMEDRQYGAVAPRIEKLVRVPARGERPGLRLTVADDACRDQAGVVEDRAVRVRN